MKDSLLPPNTEIEVVAIKGNKAHKKIMTYEQALNMRKKPGYHYRFFQLNYSQFKNN